MITDIIFLSTIISFVNPLAARDEISCFADPVDFAKDGISRFYK